MAIEIGKRRKFKAFIPKVPQKTGLISSDLRNIATSAVNRKLKKSGGLRLQMNAVTKQRMIDDGVYELFIAKMRGRGNQSI